MIKSRQTVSNPHYIVDPSNVSNNAQLSSLLGWKRCDARQRVAS